ncbi:MAG: DUF4139 domain-containing protein [Leptospiraceae bacterium]|nr:DUF4139 domain-containing protein [Leptospiraceae bacterium]
MLKKFTIFLFCISFSVFSKEPKEISTKIFKVRMYPDSVYVTRFGYVNLDKQKNQVVIRGLPQGTIDKSISLGFPKNTDIKIKKIEVKSEIELKYQNEVAKAAKKHYDNILNKVDIKNKEYLSVYHHKNVLTRLLPSKRDQSYGLTNEININSDAWGSFHKIVRIMLEENSKLELSLLKELDEMREELVVAKAKLDYYQNAEHIETKTIQVDFFSKNPVGKAKLFLNYLIGNAEWFPRYEVKVDANTKTNILYMFALVRNNTGEDWNNVNVSFSAADHTQSLDIPTIYEWRIGYKEKMKGERQRRTSEQVNAAGSTTVYHQKKLDYKEKELAKAPAPIQQQAESTVIGGEMEKNYDSRIQNLDALKRDNSAPKKPEPIKLESFDERKKLVVRDSEEQYQEVQQTSKNVLTQNRVQSKSITTEDNLSSLRANILEQQKNLQEQNYRAVLDYGQKAKENIGLLDMKYQRELSPRIREIEELSKRASIMQANAKITSGLISPKISSEGFDYRYNAKSRNTILSDNSFNKVLIGIQKLPSNISYETSPITKKSAFLVSTSVSKNKEPLLAGPLDIFVQEDYNGTTNISKTASGEELRFELGPDDDVEIERRETKFRDKSGIFIKKNTIQVNIQVIIKNKKREKILMYFVDRVPYTNDKEIDIEIKKIPKGVSIKDQGIFKQKYIIPPGESEKIILEYVISYPENSYLKEELREFEKDE